MTKPIITNKRQLAEPTKVEGLRLRTSYWPTFRMIWKALGRDKVEAVLDREYAKSLKKQAAKNEA